MSSNTTRVSLYKPAGGEDINVTTDLNNNYDKIDTNLNFRVVANAAARNAITPFWAGLNVRETDTGKLYVSNGSAPISGSWKAIPVQDSTFDADLDLASGKQVNIGGVSSTASFAVINSAVGDDLISSRITGDTQSRYLVDSDGKTWWGPGGASTQDTNLYRSATNTLTTDDSLNVGVDLSVAGSAVVTGDLTVGGVGQTQYAANTANQSATSTTTMANATNLSVPVVANAIYTFECNLSISGGNNLGNLKLGFTMPTGAAVDYAGQGLVAGTASGASGSIIVQGQENQSSPTTALVFGATTAITRVQLTGQLRMSSTAGTFQLQFAQNASNATATVLRSRSFMLVTRVA